MPAEIDEYPSLHFQDIRKKTSVADGHTDGHTDGWTNNVKTVYPHKQSLRGYNKGNDKQKDADSLLHNRISQTNVCTYFQNPRYYSS